MKKTGMLLTALMLSITLVGCGGNDEETTNDNDAATDVNTEETTDTTDTTEGTENTEENNGEQAQLEKADDIAERITEMEEVDTATVIITENNAYVAVGLHGDTEEIEQIEGRISEHVKEKKDTIENVYISVNPDFVAQMEDYGNKIDAGEPIEGFFEEFTDVVNRMFPTQG
ncbi:YhcN/YlaJ family sporulation lipoprotein [Paenisporosarcina sp. TG20]|uniref:YhcN/YlaJ family sporulation lipoprotein n=1 Tax=Paenisporosarcina sp. TG20 TaxID=1211706 RepID=UPI0003190E39|nr:YhcN/YlaJ family sporulation lipoprotein [Paenisporosarcina sp. TG20]